ncbi:MAG: alpha-mannosidase [Acidimicrobiia bacterium]|nr:alpha-mannosidase [Acidimicrobiia bacterium]
MRHDLRRTSRKLHQRLALIEPLAHRRRSAIDPFRYRVLGGSGSGDHAESSQGDDSAGSRASETVVLWGSPWGSPRTDFALRSSFAIPEEWEPDHPLALHLLIGVAGDFSHPEALVEVDGVVYGACDRHHREVSLPDRRPGERCSLELRGWSGGTTVGWGTDRRPPAPMVMGECSVVQIDQPTRDLSALTRVALGVADELSDDDPIRHGLYSAVDEAFIALDTREPLADAFYRSVEGALAGLRQAIASLGPPLDVDITAVGHAHIDVAWLWTVSQTRDKSRRTFHNVLRLMDQFPDFHFTQSQPQLYDFVRQDHSELFEGIQKQVADGRWEPIGGMWVEADCNISGAEALARQFVLGRRFFRQYFGPEAESGVLWLPDVFGYAWNLPQLIKAAGLEYFFTIKISWSEYNRLPYDSFWWQGLDGTRVLTHFSPTLSDSNPDWSTYNSEARPVDVLSTWRNFRQKDVGPSGVNAPLLMSYGYGDGGGGPTREMIENLSVMGDFPGTPRIRPGKAIEFFRQLEARVGDRLPTWNGELYLEYHRGTYTTQGRTKRANRKSEVLLHDAEFLATWAALEAGFDYPRDDLNEAWRLVCLNQFHDIVPGSSIAEVYEDAAADHERVRLIAERIRDDALRALAAGRGIGGGLVVANSCPFGGRAVVLLSEEVGDGIDLLDGATGERLTTQKTVDGTLVELADLRPYGLSFLTEQPSTSLPFGERDGRSALSVEATPSGFVLENSLLRLELDESGEIVLLYDKEAQRDVIPAGQRGNELQAFEDRPLAFDAWDIDIFYDDRQWSSEPAHYAAIAEEGPLRVAVAFTRRLGASVISQTVRLERSTRRVDFDTTVVWHERHTLLKVAFPVEVHAQVATYDIQWGNVERPTHTNTSWDWARFETCAHKWIDISEGDYGVSLLNDCKYGHDVHDNVLRLTLLRSPADPDPQADEGEHRFTYSLYPHHGDWRNGTVDAAYRLNDAPIATRIETEAETKSIAPPTFLVVDRANVVVETVKRAEDSRDVIVRLYENERCRGPVVLSLGFPVVSAERCSLLEEPLAGSDGCELVDEHTVHFDIAPFQIVTLRLRPEVNGDR